MHNIIGSTFKILGLTLILIMALDVSLTVVDTLNVRSRVKDVESYAKYELMRHNAIPSSLKGTIEKELNDVIAKSDVAVSYDWNYEHPITVDGQSFDAIGEANVKEYGEEATLVITVNMGIRRLWLLTGGASNDGTEVKVGTYRYTDPYIQTVPSLRYLK